MKRKSNAYEHDACAGCPHKNICTPDDMLCFLDDDELIRRGLSRTFGRDNDGQKEKWSSIQISIPQGLKDTTKEIARKEGLSMSRFICNLIRKELVERSQNEKG